MYMHRIDLWDKDKGGELGFRYETVPFKGSAEDYFTKYRKYLQDNEEELGLEYIYSERNTPMTWLMVLRITSGRSKGNLMYHFFSPVSSVKKGVGSSVHDIRFALNDKGGVGKAVSSHRLMPYDDYGRFFNHHYGLIISNRVVRVIRSDKGYVCVYDGENNIGREVIILSGVEENVRKRVGVSRLIGT